MFGEFANKASREEFKESLGSNGWKYFDAVSLNGFFAAEFGRLDTVRY